MIENGFFWIALAAILVCPIIVAISRHYDIRLNGKNKAVLFSSSKEALPVNLKELQTNYQQRDKVEYKSAKIEELEKTIRNLQESLTKKQEKEKNIPSIPTSENKENVPVAPPMPEPKDVHTGEPKQDLKTALHEELKKRRKKIDDED